jgi:hypothetical protein
MVAMPGATSAPGIETGDPFFDVGKNAPLVAKSELEFTAGGVQVCVIHPERPFLRRHHDFGVGKNQVVVLVLDAVDVVRVKMRNDDAADRFGVDPGRQQIGPQDAGARSDLPAGTGIDEDERVAGIDDERREWRRQLVGRHECVRERVFNIGKGGVADEVVADWPIPDTVIKRRQGQRAEAITINTLGSHFSRLYGCSSRVRYDCSGCCAGQDVATR